MYMKARALLTILLVLPTLAAPRVAAIEQEPAAALERETPSPNSLSEQATDVWFAFSQFPASDLLKELVESDDDELVAILRKDIDAIRPCCEMLRTLSPGRVKELVLLADAVLWQSQWLSNVYLGEFGIECEAPFDVGLMELSKSAGLVKQVLSGQKTVSPEVEALLRELVDMVGGEQALDYPAAWCDEQLAGDYKTALQFYKDFCAAASTPNETQAIALLKEQEEVLAYFAAKGEGEIWRVNMLAMMFHATLMELRECDYAPYPEPVLPEKLRTPARMKALQLFTDTLPALRNLLYM